MSENGRQENRTLETNVRGCDFSSGKPPNPRKHSNGLGTPRTQAAGTAEHRAGSGSLGPSQPAPSTRVQDLKNMLLWPRRFSTKLLHTAVKLRVLVTKSCLTLFETPWTVAHQAPLSTQFFRQEFWRGLPFPSPGDLPNPGVKSRSPATAGRFFTSSPPGKHALTQL